MGSLPTFRQIQFQQVPGAPPWFAGFLNTLNQFTGAVYDIVNGNVTIGTQIPRFKKTLTIAVPSSGYTPQTFKNTLPTTPWDVHIAQVQLTQGAGSTTSPISLNQWSYQNGMISLDALVGLQPNCTYQITFSIE